MSRRLPHLVVLAALVLVPVATSGAEFTSSSANPAAGVTSGDWTPPTVTLTHPGTVITGEVTLAASAADSPSGVASVRIQRSAAGSAAWVDICTDTAAPYSCVLITTTLADGPYDLRALAIDRAGNVGTSPMLANITVDNGALRGVDVQASNGGTTTSSLDRGDTLSFTWSHAVDLTTVLAGWSGASQAIAVRVTDGTLLGGAVTDDTIHLFTSTALTTEVHIGSVNTHGDLVKVNRTVVFAGRMSAATQTVAGTPRTVITVVLDAVSSGDSNLRSATGSSTMVWTPSSVAKSVHGKACSAAPITESGPFDPDF